MAKPLTNHIKATNHHENFKILSNHKCPNKLIVDYIKQFLNGAKCNVVYYLPAH